MLSLSTSPCYECAGVISPRAIAKGRGDGYLIRLNKFLVEWDRPTYIRLLPEMNGHWNPYAAFNADGSSRGAANKTKQFRRAWRRIALIVSGGRRGRVNRKLLQQGLPPIKRAKGKGPKRLGKAQVSWIWVPQTHGSPQIKKNRPGAYWPGASYVDWVGADIYGKYPNFDGLERFYRSRKNFPFMIGEWAPWDSDNPGFVNAPARVDRVAPAGEDARLLPGLRREQPIHDPALPERRGGPARAARQQTLRALRPALDPGRREGRPRQRRDRP